MNRGEAARLIESAPAGNQGERIMLMCVATIARHWRDIDHRPMRSRTTLVVSGQTLEELHDRIAQARISNAYGEDDEDRHGNTRDEDSRIEFGPILEVGRTIPVDEGMVVASPSWKAHQDAMGLKRRALEAEAAEEAEQERQCALEQEAVQEAADLAAYRRVKARLENAAACDRSAFAGPHP